MKNDIERKNSRGRREAGRSRENTDGRRSTRENSRADMTDGLSRRNPRDSRDPRDNRDPRDSREGADRWEVENVPLSDSSEEDLTEREQRRRQKRRALQRARRAQQVRRQKVIAAVLIVAVSLTVFTCSRLIHRAWAKSSLSDAVLGYSSTVEKYAKQEGIEKYVDVLLAIMMVESEGTGLDVMQSSESKGLSPGSLAPEESIEQACIYFSALLRIAGDLGIKDEKALIQSYNYGPGYLTYLSEHGGKHSEKLAIAYAKDMSGGEKVRYLHLYAIKKNGGWIYKFGNMFYETLVQQYL